MILEKVKIKACYNSSAAFSIISWALSIHTGFKVSLYKGGFEKAGGATNNFAGKTDEAKLTLHPQFEVNSKPHFCIGIPGVPLLIRL